MKPDDDLLLRDPIAYFSKAAAHNDKLKKIATAQIIFREENTGYHHGQSDNVLRAEIGGAVVGYVQYSVFEDRPHVQMLKVSPENTRKGYGTALLKELQRKFPGTEISLGMQTDDGSKLLERMNFSEEPTEHAPLFEELKNLKEEEARLEAVAEEYYAGEPSIGPEKDRFTAQMERLQAVNDRVWELEQELGGKRPTKRLIQAAFTYTPERMEAEAHAHEGQFEKSSPGGGPASNYTWTQVDNFPVAQLEGTAEQWKEWLDQEKTWAAEGGRGNYFEEMEKWWTSHPDEAMVVAHGKDGKYYVWEGTHRQAIAKIHGMQTVPALLGELKINKVAAQRAIYYHGTTFKNLRSILSEGLVPEGKAKSWADDPSATISGPSKQTYGGSYLTRNLMTAIGAPRDEKSKPDYRMVLVAVEAQPNTMFLDEDSIVGWLDSPFGNGGQDSAEHLVGQYFLMTRPDAPESMKQAFRDAQERYIERTVVAFKNLLDQKELKLNSELEKRLRELLPGMFVASLTRRVAHAYKSDQKRIERDNYDSRNYDYRRMYSQIFGNVEVPPKESVIPSVQDAETKFREIAEQLTRSLRSLLRIQQSGGWQFQNGRVIEPIGYSGSNHIITVLEIREGRGQRIEYNDPEGWEGKSSMTPIVVHYGTVPEDWKKQWAERVGSKIYWLKPGETPPPSTYVKPEEPAKEPESQPSEVSASKTAAPKFPTYEQVMDMSTDTGEFDFDEQRLEYNFGPDEYAEAIGTLKRLKFPLTVYRGFALKEGEKIRFDRVGLSWSLSESTARSAPKSHSPERHGYKYAVVTARIGSEAVDWLNTVRSWMMAYGEQELRLKRNAKIQLLSPMRKTVTAASTDDIPNPLPVTTTPDAVTAWRNLPDLDRQQMLKEAEIIEVDPRDLKTTQNSVSKEHLDTFLNDPKRINEPLEIADHDEHPLVLDTDEGMFVFDGNHRCAAALMLKRHVKVQYIDLRPTQEFRPTERWKQRGKNAARLPLPSLEQLAEAYEGDISADDENRYDYWIKTHNAETHFPLTLYRIVGVPNSKKIRWNKIGTFWSLSEAGAYKGAVETGEFGDKDILYCVRAILENPNDVDWFETLRANIIFGSEESEVTLKPGRKLKLVDVKAINEQGHTRMGEGFKPEGVEFVVTAANKETAYTAYVLTKASRDSLLSKFPPKFPDVIAHHVTLQFGVPQDTAVPEAAKIEVVGYAADDSLEAVVVSVNGETKRPDGSTYHVTLSLDRTKGRKPVQSNEVVSKGWEPVLPFVLETLPQKLADGTTEYMQADIRFRKELTTGERGVYQTQLFPTEQAATKRGLEVLKLDWARHAHGGERHDYEVSFDLWQVRNVPSSNYFQPNLKDLILLKTVTVDEKTKKQTVTDYAQKRLFAKAAAIDVNTRIFYHGTNDKRAFDEVRPDVYGILWLADAVAARDYTTKNYNQGEPRLFEVTLKPNAELIDIRDLSDPIVRQYKENEFPNVSDAEYLERWATWRRVEGSPKLVKFMKSHGVDGILVNDQLKRRRPHASLAIINREAIASQKLLKTADKFNEEGFWAGEGNAASGVLPVCPATGRVGLAMRSGEVDYPHTFSTIGGAVKTGMSPIQSAKVELKEETGYGGAITLTPAYVFTSEGGFSYHNFIGVVPVEFKLHPPAGESAGVEFKDENASLDWVTWEELMQDIETNAADYHPEFLKFLRHSGALIERAMGKKKAAGKDPSLEAFMNDFWSQTAGNPFNNRERVYGADAIFEARPFNGSIHLSFIRSVEKKKGLGSKGLDWFCALADKHGVKIDLDPKPVGKDGLHTTQLLKWYASRGFAKQKGMGRVRLPRGEKVPVHGISKKEASGEKPMPKRLAALSKTIPSREAIPDFDTFLRMAGGLQNLVREFDEHYEEWPQLQDVPPEQQQEKIDALAYQDLSQRFQNAVGEYWGWEFPMTIYREIHIPNIAALRLDHVGINWAYDENTAEAHWGGKGDKWLLRGQIQENAINWFMTIYHNIWPSLGENEKEVTIKQGAKIELLGVMSRGDRGSQPVEHKPPKRFVTASDDKPLVGKEAAAKLPKGWRVTLKHEKAPGTWFGVYWGHIWQDGQFRGVCPVGSEYRDKARQAAIDWAWDMSGQPRPKTTDKTSAARHFKPLPFEEFAKQHPEHDFRTMPGMNDDRERYEENVEHFSTIDFPLTLWRALELEKGQEPNWDAMGVHWTWVANSADAYFGSNSIWSPHTGPKLKNPVLVIVEAVLSNPDDVDWNDTLVSNMVNPEENEVWLKAGARLQLVGIESDEDYNNPGPKTIIAKQEPKDAASWSGGVGNDLEEPLRTVALRHGYKPNEALPGVFRRESDSITTFNNGKWSHTSLDHSTMRGQGADALDSYLQTLEGSVPAKVLEKVGKKST
jgi:8-oxo-dGTP pyrophosphatase MutT (NUDIX family)/ribosomal protein S18 acetylase RimI-like enzyme